MEPSSTCTSRDMHTIYKMKNHGKSHDTNVDIYVYIFIADNFNTDQCKVTDPSTLLFNRPSCGILLRFSRPHIVCDNAESNYTALINRQPQLNNM